MTAPDSVLGAALFQSSEACAHADRLRDLLRELVEAYDQGHVQMASDEIETEGQKHPWHEEWLHHARIEVS